MANDPRDLSGKRLQQALYLLGRNPSLRKEFIDFLKRVEPRIDCGGAVRDDVTGPIIDALHDDEDRYEKTLADGTKFQFLFRTKIARDFLLADDERPSHVWEPQTTRLLLHLTAGMKGDVIVGGAYFGDQAVLVGKNIAPQGGCVHCFEPNQAQADMLQTNIGLNSLPNMVVNRLGLWSQSSVRLRLDGFDSFANAVEAAPGEDGFQTVTIDDYRAKAGFEAGLIQLDIEGAEYGALCGAAKTIEQCRPNIVFEVHRDYVDWTPGLENTPICSLLRAAGYTVFAVRDFNTHRELRGKPVEIIPVDKVYLEGPAHGFNMVAVHDSSVLSGPGFKIVENVSPKLLLHKSPGLHHPTDGL